jgi:acyl-CoA synthetase (AMP-forming)/AMP-acid ligase II
MRLSGYGRDDAVRSTVVSLLSMRAEQQPETIAYSFISDEGERSITYAELDRRAKAIGCVLAGRRLTGEPVLLLYPPGIDYLAAFFGCLYAGVIAVPAYPPAQARLENSQCWLAAIARDAMPAAALMPTLAGSPLTALSTAVPDLSRSRPSPSRWPCCSTPPGQQRLPEGRLLLIAT